MSNDPEGQFNNTITHFQNVCNVFKIVACTVLELTVTQIYTEKTETERTNKRKKENETRVLFAIP